MLRRSAPPSSRWVANECLSVCGETPPWIEARRTAPASRRRTSDVDSRRPVFDRNSAGIRLARQLRAATVQPRAQRAPRRLPGGHDPGPSALALHAQLLGVRVQAGQVQVHHLLGTQAGRVGQLEHGAIAHLQRCRAGHGVQQGGQLGGLEHGRQVGVAFGRGHQVGRAGLEAPGANELGVEGAGRRQLARHGRARHAALGQHPGEPAQGAEVQLLWAQPLGAGPLRQLAHVDAVGAARLLGQVLAPHALVEAAQGRAPTRVDRRSVGVLRQHSGWPRRGAAPARGGRARGR